jgi:hypothetical protein
MQSIPRIRKPVPALPRRAGRRAGRRLQRGTNARLIEEVLQSNAPRALRPAEIGSALQRAKGVAMARRASMNGCADGGMISLRGRVTSGERPPPDQR